MLWGWVGLSLCLGEVGFGLGAGRRGGVSICDDKSRGNILQGGHASGFNLVLSCMVEVEMVRLW